LSFAVPPASGTFARAGDPVVTTAAERIPSHNLDRRVGHAEGKGLYQALAIGALLMASRATSAGSLDPGTQFYVSQGQSRIDHADRRSDVRGAKSRRGADRAMTDTPRPSGSPAAPRTVCSRT
jgi:hypothetical protein